MKKTAGREAIISIFWEVLLLIIIGALAVLAYGYPLKFNRMILFFLSFGASSVLLFNILKYYGFKAFAVTLVILIFVLTPLIFKNPTVYSVIHHAAWVLGLGIIIFLMKQVYPEKSTFGARVLVIFLWIAAITAFFMVVFVVNGIILKYRHQLEAVEFSRVVIRALKFGPVLGAGIGIGNFIRLTMHK